MFPLGNQMNMNLGGAQMFGTNNMLGVNLGGQQGFSGYNPFIQPNIIQAPPIYINGGVNAPSQADSYQQELDRLDFEMQRMQKQMALEQMKQQMQASLYPPPPPPDNKLKKLLPILGIGGGAVLLAKKCPELLEKIPVIGPFLTDLFKPKEEEKPAT